MGPQVCAIGEFIARKSEGNRLKKSLLNTPVSQPEHSARGQHLTSGPKQICIALTLGYKELDHTMHTLGEDRKHLQPISKVI